MISVMLVIVYQQDVMINFPQWREFLYHPSKSVFILLEPLVSKMGYLWFCQCFFFCFYCSELLLWWFTCLFWYHHHTSFPLRALTRSLRPHRARKSVILVRNCAGCHWSGAICSDKATVVSPIWIHWSAKLRTALRSWGNGIPNIQS